MSRFTPRVPWPPDFPDVVVQQSANSPVRLKDQPGYEAAKRHYDVDAAADVVEALVDGTRMDQLRSLIGDRRPVLVAVEADEDGRNALPIAYAEALGHLLGIPAATGIVQCNRTFRTGAGSDHRLLARAAFNGGVQPGQSYVIVDDVVTQGGTLADLRSYIEHHGGQVIAATTLIGAGGSGVLALRIGTLEALRHRFGSVEPDYGEPLIMDMKVLPKARPERSSASEWLTTSEIESLRQQQREALIRLAERRAIKQRQAVGSPQAPPLMR